jgi:hypothetical protein
VVHRPPAVAAKETTTNVPMKWLSHTRLLRFGSGAWAHR